MRTDLVGAKPDSWGVFFEERYRGKMTELDDMRDVIGSWLKFRGHSLNSTVPAELAAGPDRCAPRQAQPQVLPVRAGKGQLIAGDVWIAQLWNGDTAQARAVQPGHRVRDAAGRLHDLSRLHVHPARRNAPPGRPRLHELHPGAGQCRGDSRHTGYGSPNAAALAEDPTIPRPPTPEEMARLEYQDDLGAATAEWDRIWTEIKAVRTAEEDQKIRE